MTKEEMFNNVCKLTKQAQIISPSGVVSCSYYNGTGCAIGCQPGFKEQFPDIPEGHSIRRQPKVVIFFNVPIEFLTSLQHLHDINTNWDQNGLTQEAKDLFRKNYL